MSRRTAEANKAIRLAWEREQKLVRNGQGTRDWPEQQQKDILDPNKGKAYDNEGRAFEGQHMKSVSVYPEFQGNPDNIQFLTHEEHLEAHKGNWQNPTNGYYDPNTKEFVVFEEDEIIPCKIINLTNPISDNISITGEKIKENRDKIERKSEERETNLNSEENSELREILEEQKPQNKNTKPIAYVEEPREERRLHAFLKDIRSKLITTAKLAGNYIKENPVEVFEGFAATIGSIAGIMASKNQSSRKTHNSNQQTTKPIRKQFSPDISKKSEINSSSDEVIKNLKEDIIPITANDISVEEEKIKRASPVPHTVKANSQLYHTKDGDKVIQKKEYSRGGDKK